jgi:hypothetical protein
MSLLTQEARDKAHNSISELRRRLSVELSAEDWRILIRQAEIIASETVILTKNRINNL